MKNKKRLFGIVMVVIGIVFLAVGIWLITDSNSNKADRIYTTATVVGFRGDDTYVEFEVDGEIVQARINSTDSTDYVGRTKNIYYFKDDTRLVYEKSTDIVMWVFPIMGGIVVVLGILTILDKVKVTAGGRYGRELTNDGEPAKREYENGMTCTEGGANNQYDNGSDTIQYEDSDDIFE